MRRLENIRTENSEICDASLCHAPAAITIVPAFLNGTVSSRIPDNKVRLKALKSDPMTNLLLEIVANLGLSQNKSKIDTLHHVYHHPACQGQFTMRDGILYMKEIFRNDVKFVDLRIVPESLQNINFMAFHAKPIGDHLDTPCTFHCMRQQYFWPGMFNYVKQLVKACPGCSLSNITQHH